MTLDEAIKHCEEVANKCKTGHFSERIKAMECSKEHRQLAEWLKELKAYREQSGDEELDFVPEHKKIPCTLIIGKPCEDAISRRAVLDEIDRRFDLAKPFKQLIESMPSVTPQPIDKSAMMYEIYMNGVNMSGEYQGCWVRFKDIEKIVDEYMAESEGKE